MDSTEFVDPYLDPETGQLRNKIGARTKVALDDAEGDLSFARLMQLLDRPVKPTGDLDELRAIHRHLFQDVYDWAGELRVVDIRKNAEGAQFFLPVLMIGQAAMFAEGELREDHALRGMDRDQFIDRLAYHYDAFNYIHPFREGNGRTQRVFWNRIARDAGWQLDWRAVRGATNDQASRAASDMQDFGPLRDMFSKIVTKVVPESERDSDWRAAERARLSFPTPATEAVRQPPSSPAQEPQARTIHMPGQSYRDPGTDTPGVSRRVALLVGITDITGYVAITNDFVWLTNGDLVSELKSTSTSYRNISRRISDAVLKAAKQGVSKSVFVIDLGEEALDATLRKSLSKYNLHHIKASPDAQIKRLFVMSSNGNEFEEIMQIAKR